MDNHRKGSNFIIFIFVVLILLPSVFLIPITNFIIKNGTDFLKFPIFTSLSAIIASVSTIVGVFMIYQQINKDKKINASRFLVELNNYLMSSENVKKVFGELLKLENKKYDHKQYEKVFGSDSGFYDIVEYLNFFESIEFFLRKGILKIEEINDMFSKRFFIAVNNPYIQDEKLIKYDYSWRNIYKLSRSLIEYKYYNDLEEPYAKYSISKSKGYYKYSDGYFNYRSIKNNALLIFIFSSILFLIFLFFILLSLKYPINTISSIIGVCGSIIGAVSIIFQLNAENNINKARFFFELNKSFITRDEYKIVFIAATNNFYYKLPFTDKNNKIKSISTYDLSNYLAFFESLNVMLENRALHISDVYFLFGYRLFFVVNNPYVQKMFLFKNNYFFKNVYRLYDKMLKYYKRNNGKAFMDYKEFALDKMDKEYYNLVN